MPTPKPPPPLSPRMAEIYALFHAIAQSDRTTTLVDYLEDLRREFDWVSAELKELGFCAVSYLSERGEGDDDDFLEED